VYLTGFAAGAVSIDVARKDFEAGRKAEV
jgi:hypothetical protein